MKVYPAIILFLVILIAGCNDNSSGSQQDPCKNFDQAAQANYLESNAQNPNVTITESGLQYRVIEEGDGDQPSENSTVKLELEGRFINGTVFDSTSEPTNYPVDYIGIEGFKEGVLLMREGATYEFVIPSELGFGQEGAGEIICPGATLIYEVTLIEIV